MVTTEQVKELRNKTGVSVMQCKKALEESGGDLNKAMDVLKKKGADIAAKKAGRDLNSGVVSSYIHNTSRVGAMVELLSETDFVANNDDFKTLAYEIAMQIAATPEDLLEKKETLLKQDFIKDPDKTIDDLIKEATQKFGERIEIGRFEKFSI